MEERFGPFSLSVLKVILSTGRGRASGNASIQRRCASRRCDLRIPAISTYYKVGKLLPGTPITN